MNMNKKHKSRWLRQLYTAFADSKLIMCIFYSYYVWMYVFMGWLSGAEVQTLDIALANQMMIPALITGLAQIYIVPSEKITIRRNIIWTIVSVLTCYAIAVLFNWFSSFPLWAEWTFWGVLVIGYIFMILYLYFKLENETRELNEHLTRFKQGVEENENN